MYLGQDIVFCPFQYYSRIRPSQSHRIAFRSGCKERAKNFLKDALYTALCHAHSST